MDRFEEGEAALKEFFVLIYTFAKIGLFTFGGGYAMLPLLEREIVRKHGWASMEELSDYYAIGQCTPGIIAVNVATFVGYKSKGILGGILATLGLIFPSMVVITLVAGLLDVFSENAYVISAFAGVRVCVCVLILDACIKFVRSSIKDIFAFTVFILVLLGSLFLDWSPAIFVIAAALGALIFDKLRQVRAR